MINTYQPYLKSKGLPPDHRVYVCTRCRRRHQFEATHCLVCKGLLVPEQREAAK